MLHKLCICLLTLWLLKMYIAASCSTSYAAWDTCPCKTKSPEWCKVLFIKEVSTSGKIICSKTFCRMELLVWHTGNNKIPLLAFPHLLHREIAAGCGRVSTLGSGCHTRPAWAEIKQPIVFNNHRPADKWLVERMKRTSVLWASCHPLSVCL